MKEEQAERIIQQLENMNCRLVDIQHFIQEIAEYGVLQNELREAIIAIGRAQSKELDAKYRTYEDAEGAHV